MKQISNLPDCSIVADWIQPCANHLHWSAVTTSSGDGDLIWAKFQSFLSHITDKHTGLNDPFFNKCAHSEDIEDRNWLAKGKPSLVFSIVFFNLPNALLYD